MKAPKLAQEVAGRYFIDADEYQSHADNVQKYLRGPVQAVTLYVLQEAEMATTPDTMELPPPPISEEEKKCSGSDWRDYLASMTNANATGVPDLNKVNQEAFDALGQRTKARLEGFLTGVSLAVIARAFPKNHRESISNNNNSNTPDNIKDNVKAKAAAVISLSQGLAGFNGEKKHNNDNGHGPVFRPLTRQSSSGTGGQQARYQQINESELVTRLELYIRSLWRVKVQGQECVIVAEPHRAMKARARSIVVAFIDTVDTVHQQAIVLTRLYNALVQELLAVEFLSDSLTKLVHRLVADYVQNVSFASLAFLSSPEAAADKRLTPMVLKFLRYLQTNWRECVAECELERMLTLSIDLDLRQTLKNIEFRSIGHLLEVCQGFRHELHHIALSPDMRASGGDETVCENNTDNEALRQALRDLQREVITINGNVLPPVTSRKELISVLSQTLALTSTVPSAINNNPRRNKSSRASSSRLTRRSESDGAIATSASKSGDELTTSTSGDDSDLSGYKGERKPRPEGLQRSLRRRRSFRLSTVDFLTKRLLLAASRTGTGGDAYFVVRDLFGGEDVEVVPSQHVYAHGRNVRPGSIEIIVKLASVTIKCHGSFDVYPKSLVGDCEPLIQLHTTTAETIGLQEVRASDSTASLDKGGAAEAAAANGKKDGDDSDEGEPAVMVVQERKTDRTGWRYLSIRPALYEKYEEFSTPS